MLHKICPICNKPIPKKGAGISERNIYILKVREVGRSYVSIAREFDICPQRVSQIVQETERKLNNRCNGHK